MNIKKIAQNTKYNAVTNTAMCAESTPVYAAFETGVAGMTDAVSLNARLIVLGAGYCGAAWVYGQGRSMWRKAFKITDQTREAKQHLHDAMYAVSFIFFCLTYGLHSQASAKAFARVYKLSNTNDRNVTN